VVALQLVLAATVFSSSPHTGGDNAGYVGLAYSLLDRGAYLDLHDPAEPLHTKYPPVYPAVLALAMAFGARNWGSLKLLSGLFMTGALLVGFLWMERRRGPWLAFVVAVLLALSEAFLWHTHWILSDPLFVLLTLTCIWAADRAGEDDAPVGWLVLACAAAVLAFFTRSAGLPLVIAVGGWLGLRRRWAALAGFALAFGVPAALWWLRARGALEAGYVAEFWLVDPYRPALGTVGASDLALRALANVRAYGGRWIPGGLIGLQGNLVAAMGVLLLGMAGVAWLRRVHQTRITVVEVFIPLYMGLLLLWPVVWAGDRFALPLYPLLLFYAGETLLLVTERARPGVRVGVVLVAVLPFIVPATALWRISAKEAGECRAVIREAGPFGCASAAVREFVKSAEWSAANMPADATVFSRKPRLFYVLSGVKGRVYPMVQDPEVFLEEARAQSVDYVVLDYLDRLGAYYLVPVIQDGTASFCSLVGFGSLESSRTEIFGLLPPEEATFGDSATDVETEAVVVNLRVCAGSPPGGDGSVDPPFSSATIPLLQSLDSP